MAGISVGSGRIKISKIPRQDSATGEAKKRKSLLKRSQGGGAEEEEVDDAEASDRRRAGVVFGFLRKVVEGQDEAEEDE